MSAITKEQAESGICPECGSDLIGFEYTEAGQPVWTCFDCSAIWFKNRIVEREQRK